MQTVINELKEAYRYFKGIDRLFYEQDLIDRYGQDIVHKGIRDGWLDHARIPCGQGRFRCVCRLNASLYDDENR